MTLETLAERLKGTGLPVAYLAFPAGEAPAMPFLCYRSTGTNTLPADGAVYHTWEDVLVDLYTSSKSPAMEKKVESALAGIYWQKTEIYMAEERCYLIRYEIEV